MERISSIEQYNSILRQIKRHESSFTNNYLVEESIKELIDEQLVFYEIAEDSLLVFVDQKRYYTLYVQLTSESEKNISGLNKEIVTSVIYREGNEPQDIEEFLHRNGFDCVSTLRGLSYNPQDVLNNIQITADSIQNELEGKGYRIVKADTGFYKQIFEFVDGIDEIPYWDISFRSGRGFAEDCERGLVHIVVDKNNSICAANYNCIYGKYEYGWIAVAKEYRKTFGMSLVLSKYKMAGMIERNHLGSGWIRIDNPASLRYHLMIGEKLNGRIKKQYLRGRG